MMASGLGFVLRRAALMILVLIVGGGSAGVGTVAAQPGASAAGDWEPTGLTQAVSRLFNPTSGALLAVGAGQLRRSDDGGTTWREVSLPAGTDLSFAVGDSYRPAHVGPGQLAVDPNNHDVMYVRAGGLQKSTDGGATWTLLPVQGTVVAVAVSPADSSHVHAVTAVARTWQRIRSRDGGMTWEEIASFSDTPVSGRPGMDYSVYLLQPHPTDPERVFIAAGGTTGRSTKVGLYDSSDGPNPPPGVALLKVDPGYFIDAEHLVGGSAAAPGRYYAAFNRRVSPYSRTTTAKLMRVEMGGGQTVVMEVDGGGSVSGMAPGDALDPAVHVDALAYDPSAPDRVYAGVNEYQVVVQPDGRGVQLTRTRSHVVASTDGGATWADLGREDLGSEIRDLALGIDGANLYAGTEGGVFRLSMAR